MTTHGRLNVEVFVEPNFQENALLLWPEAQAACWILDPGFAPQPDQLVTAVREYGLTPAAILLTHCHADHLAGVEALRAVFPKAALTVPRAEAFMLADATANLSALFGVPITCADAERLVDPGDTLTLGSLSWRVLDVGGHSPGGLAYYCAEAGVVLTGDALFAGGIGRYDFPGSSRTRLLRNIRENLLALPTNTVLYAGHGPSSTIGDEQRYNMVLRAEMAE